MYEKKDLDIFEDNIAVKKNKPNKKIALLCIFLLVLGVVFGVIGDSLFGPVINIHQMTDIETKEQLIAKMDSNEEMEDKLIELVDECYSASTDYESLAGAFYNELYAIEEEHDSTEYEKYAETNSLKGFLLDLSSRRLKVFFDIFAGYCIAPDTRYFAEAYKDRLSSEAYEYLIFRAEETESHLFSEEFDTIDIDKIIGRVDFIDSKLEKNKSNKDYPFTYAYEQLKNYYLSVLRGDNHSFFRDTDTLELTSYAKNKFLELSGRDDKIGEIAVWQLSQ